MRPATTSMLFSLLVIAMAGCSGGDVGGEHTGGATIADTVVEGRARDPICGMIGQAAGNPEFVYRDTRFHFCSADCLEKFKTASAKATTGLPGEGCVCSVGEMQKCKCAHCKGKPARCACGDPER